MAPNSPACSFIHKSIAGSRSTVPLNRSKFRSPRGYTLLLSRILESAADPSPRFESYLPVPGCDIFLILHGIPETLSLDSELAQSVQGHQSAMRVECHDVGEDAAECEGLSRFAQCVDERIIPCGAISDVIQNTMQFSVGL